MNRTKVLQEIRQMRFVEAYVGWQARRLTQGHARYSRMVASRASTSSITGSGTASRRLPFRAPRSRARGWSHRITPVVRVPVSLRETAKPRRRAKSPPVVMGRTTGVPVILLNAPGETINTGRVPRCSCPVVGSRLTSQISPRFTKGFLCRPASRRASHDPQRNGYRSRRTAPEARRGCSWDAPWVQ